MTTIYRYSELDKFVCFGHNHWVARGAKKKLGRLWDMRFSFIDLESIVSGCRQLASCILFTWTGLCSPSEPVGALLSRIWLPTEERRIMRCIFGWGLERGEATSRGKLTPLLNPIAAWTPLQNPTIKLEMLSCLRSYHSIKYSDNELGLVADLREVLASSIRQKYLSTASPPLRKRVTLWLG